MGKKRKMHSPQFKAKVALAAIQNDETTAQIASRFGVHPTMVSTWKRQMLDGAPDIFDKTINPGNRLKPKPTSFTARSVNSRWKTIFYHESSAADPKAA
jgi:transposase